MADGSGYNPYRKENGEFASKGEVGDLNEKLASDLVDAQDAGDERLATQIEDYAMEKLPESPIGKKLLEERYGAAATASKSENPHSKLGIRELQKLAKDTEDRDLQLEIASRGNDAARKNLARNQFASTEALEAAYIATDDDATRRELAANLHSDLRIMHPSHVAHALSRSLELAQSGPSRSHRERAESAAASDWMDDSTVAELRKLGATKLVRTAMKNPHNLISEDSALDYAKSSPLAGSVVIESGRLSPERLKEFPAESARFEWSSDNATLTEASRLSAEGHWDRPEKDPYGKEDPYGRESRAIADRIIAANGEVYPEVLDRFVGNPRADQLKLYRNPRLSDASKRRLEESDPTVGSELRIERAAEAQGGRFQLRKDLVLSGEETSTRRGYHSADIQLDRAKVEAYGLSKGDVERFLGGEGAYSYDPETGRYSGSFDSGD